MFAFGNETIFKITSHELIKNIQYTHMKLL